MHSTDDRSFLIDDVPVPRILYGTAWKKEDTQRLTELAIRQGFRGIDTANQRRHYYEEGVGKATAAAMASELVDREDLFLQTKFTFQAGQDHRLPYDPAAPIATQVEQSFASSQQHLDVDRIDSYVLHGPTRKFGLGPHDWEAWRAMEAIHASGRAKLLGVSNVTLEELQELCQDARVRPHFVQNRCFAVNGWDSDMRRFCGASGIAYQGFSLLTANREALASTQMARIAGRHGRDTCQIVFRFALDVGMVPLTGTTNSEHMQTDLEVFDFRLDPDEVAQIETIARQ